MSRHAAPRPVRVRHALLITALVLAACGDPGAAGPSYGTTAEVNAAAPLADRASASDASIEVLALQERRGEAAPAASPAPSPTTTHVLPGTAPMLVRTGAATIEVDSLEPAIAAMTRTAAALGGVLGNTNVVAGDGQVRRATLELRVPAARFDEALAGLRPLGDVESVSTSAEDVGEEYVDTGARMANARRLEERLVQLLATRTGKLEDVLAVERELARVREEIERHEGRLRFLRTRAATSTLVLSLHEPVPIVGEGSGGSVLGDAFARAWRGFVGTIALLIASTGVVVPIALLLGAAAWAVRRWRAPRGRAAVA
jgi:hypothetical protein